MSRRGGFVSTIRAVAREAERAQRQRQREVARHYAAQIKATEDAERRARAQARAQAAETKADAKEAARLHVQAQMDEAAALTARVRAREQAVETLLAQSLQTDPKVDLELRKARFTPGRFQEHLYRSDPPRATDYLATPPTLLQKLVPGSKASYAAAQAAAKRRYDEAIAEHERKCSERELALRQFQAAEQERNQEVERQNRKIDEFKQRLADGHHLEVVEYFQFALKQSFVNELVDAASAEVGYSPDSKHLVVDLDLPDSDVAPDEAAYKYVKATDSVEAIPRPLAKQRVMYANLISQITLKCLDVIFRSSPGDLLECVTINGMLNSVDPATGRPDRMCLISVRVTPDGFHAIDLKRVQPEICLRALRASVSRSPLERVPVKPLIELDMVDPRFVDSVDVLSGLDRRPNLMDLTPNEFENLITNLFAVMGLDTKQTRPSRDGGVDCVAFDPRPVFGGKVVIQAKRYKNTVGVSAVRDLFGTVQNEGASKGILITTSGYGKAAFEFAKGKPLELLDGGNLLHLLSEHAQLEARIIMPEGWVDQPLHGE